MPTLPPINTGSAAMFPVGRAPGFRTQIATFEDGSEQRWMDHAALYSFELRYQDVSKLDKDNLNAFAASVLGPASPWTFNWFARGSLAPTAAPYNGNFENGLSGWGFSVQGPSWTAYTTGVSYDGSQAAVIQTLGTSTQPNTLSVGRLQSSLVGISSGQPVTISFWVGTNPTDAPNPAGVTSGAQCRVNCMASDGTLLSQVDPGIIIPSGTGWQQINFNINPPAGTTAVALILFGFVQNENSSAYTGTCTVIFDNVSITGTNNAYLYTNCVFDDDTSSFAWTEESQGNWSGSIRFHQIAAGGAATSRFLYAFPPLGPSGTQVTGFPFGSRQQFKTLINDNPSGGRVAYPMWGAGRPSGPSRPLKRWTLPLTTLNDADLIALEGHYIGAGGRYRNFGLIDPETGIFYPRCRYDMDSLQITHVQYGISSATVQIVETFGPGWTA